MRGGSRQDCLRVRRPRLGHADLVASLNSCCLSLLKSIVMISEHSTFQDAATFASDHSLTDLVGNSQFVRLVQNKEPDHTDEYYYLLEVLSDAFHDFFSLDAGQRKSVSRNLRDRSMSIKDMYEMLRSDDEPFSKGPRPEVTAHSATGLSGPYPTRASDQQRGRSPSVLQWEEPTEAERQRPSSMPPRVGPTQARWNYLTTPSAPPPTISDWAKQYYDRMGGGRTGPHLRGSLTQPVRSPTGLQPKQQQHFP